MVFVSVSFYCIINYPQIALTLFTILYVSSLAGQLLLVWPRLHTPLPLQSPTARAWMCGEEEVVAVYAVHHSSPCTLLALWNV